MAHLADIFSSHRPKPGRAAMSREQLDFLRFEQVAAFYRNAAPGAFGSLFAAVILAGMLFYIGGIPLRSMLIFDALVGTSIAGRFVLLRAYARAKPEHADWRRWGIAATLSALAGGVAWGSATLFLMVDGRADLQLLVFLTAAGMSAGSITAFGTFLPAYYCSLFPMMVPTVIWSMFQSDTLHWTYAILSLLWIVIMAMLARTFSRILVESLSLQFENLSLANSLRQQKEVAEAANVAKSRFLAAASHDLRQPVHAIEMFVGALAGQPMSSDARRLVGQIKGSVDSLGGLFNSILDISRLDAGIVDARPRPFPIAPLLERICRDERQVADRKNVDVRLMHSSAIVEADPVLLERILRNLISNAARYTEAGRILIGCRRGKRLSIEVWDTGPGISEAHRELIFQEFFQVGNSERSRTRGLGLGLAIVRRLSGILHMPVTLESVQGKGSAFKVSVPLSVEAIEMPHGVPDDSAVFDFQRKLRIFVIDDEPEIQVAMQALLGAWGHAVVAAGSGDDIIAQIDGMKTPPDLVISDYRLRGGENGLHAIKRLRERFDGGLPAILITGDTAPDRLREAAASGCFLMHKPISNARLRAAITNLTKPDEGRPV
ncbi:MAG: hybrid sensor histidine kinase/response regulator [Xanthobacteraceae bacterium]|uniref:ATP-binding response regulator n=1 Tax=Pseudolabrys sp. TaxID=1960880 RepID=UPI003D0FED60